MTGELTSSGRSGGPTRPLRIGRHFSMLFSATPRGARLARRLAGEWLDTWGLVYGSSGHDAVTLIVAELSANAVRHGCDGGRDFHLELSTSGGQRVRVELTDTGPGFARRIPEAVAGRTTGRGLMLVDALASRWDVRLRKDGPGKTVVAEYDVPAGGSGRGA